MDKLSEVSRPGANTVWLWSCKAQFSTRERRENLNGTDGPSLDELCQVVGIYSPSDGVARARRSGRGRRSAGAIHWRNPLAQYAGAMRWLHVSRIEKKKKKLQWGRKRARARPVFLPGELTGTNLMRAKCQGRGWVGGGSSSRMD